MRSFKTRKCSPKDLPAVSEIAQSYASFDTKLNFSDVEALQARNPEYFFVAEEDNGQVVGFVTGYERKGILEEVLRSWNANRVGYVELLAVHPSHRGRGVGRALMNAILDEFRTNSVDIVNLDVPADQEAAQHLYRKMGFSVRAYNMRKRLT